MSVRRFLIDTDTGSDDAWAIVEALCAAVIGQQLLPLRNIRSEITRPQKRRGADTNMYLCGSRFLEHAYDPVTGRSPDNGIINHNHPFPAHRFL